MRREGWRALVRGVVLAVLAVGVGWGQGPGDQIAGDLALDRALKSSSLTYEGIPFHAVMDLGSAGSLYAGRIELWWLNATRYRLVIASASLQQEKTVNGQQVEEHDQGDYEPRWLDDLVRALLDPVPMASTFRGRSGQIMLGDLASQECLRRDDRPGGITDQMTWGELCFTGLEPRLVSALTFNVDISFSDWQSFGSKQIPRTYETSAPDGQPIMGRLTLLEKLRDPDAGMLVVQASTPAAQRIQTAFVSTAESLVEHAPEITWPPVRGGKTNGYMMVYARTDRTGQVRETAKHNSDQPGLESFGIEQALRYKFKPLLVDGVPRQMEMPLVLRFSTHLDNPVPVLSVEKMKKQMGSCKIASTGTAGRSKASVRIRFSIDETGKVTGYGPVGQNEDERWVGPVSAMEDCRFAPYIVNGKATYYKGDVEVSVP